MEIMKRLLKKSAAIGPESDLKQKLSIGFGTVALWRLIF